METEPFALGFDLPLYVDWIGIAVGSLSIWYVQKLRRAGRTLDRAAVFFVWGVGVFVASLVWERLAEGLPALGLPHEEPHHLLMMLSMLTFTVAASKFVPEKDEMVREVETRKRLERQLGERELKFRTLAEHAPVGIFLLDPEGKTLYANPMAAQLAGVTPEEAAGQGWAKHIHPDDAARTFAALERGVREKSANSHEFRFMIAGGVRWVLTHTVPIQERSEAGGFIGTVTDITEVKKATEALAIRQEELERMTHSMVGREKRMVELKEELERLKKKG